MLTRKSITLAAALVTGSVSAGSSYHYDGSYIESIGNRGTSFLTWLDPKNDCEIVHGFWEEATNEWEEEIDVEFKIKVDKLVHWDVDAILIKEWDNNTLMFEGNSTLLKELIRGNVLRLKVGSWQEGFSLIGYTRAFSQAYEHCQGKVNQGEWL